MIESEKKRIRKEFQPLTIAVSLKIMTPNSPANQVYNPVANEYDPDRGVTPLVILPEVIANAADGSWDMPYVNSLLAEMNWFVNGKNLSAISSWNGKYSIDTVGDTRGAITISRNVAPGESFELHFEGVIADTRLGVNIPVKTDSIMLTTVDKSEDTYGLSIGDSQIIQYNPFLDKLLLYDYKVANKLISASTANKNAALDENSYERTIPLMVTKGVNKITTGYTIELYQVNSISSQGLNMTGYSAYLNNIYMTGTIEQLQIDEPVRIEIDTQGDNFLAYGESMEITCKVFKGWEDITDTVRQWTIRRDSGDTADDEAWNIKHKDFNGSITIHNTKEISDLGNNSVTVVSTLFTITATNDTASVEAIVTI